MASRLPLRRVIGREGPSEAQEYVRQTFSQRLRWRSGEDGLRS